MASGCPQRKLPAVIERLSRGEYLGFCSYAVLTCPPSLVQAAFVGGCLDQDEADKAVMNFWCSWKGFRPSAPPA